MNKIFFLSAYFLLSVGLNAQTWKYSSRTSDFDGEYKIVSAYGYGGEFPYEAPRFIVRDMNGRITLFIADLGYTGCDGNELIIVFDSERKYYVSTNLLIESTDKDALFIAGMRKSWDSEVLTEYHLLDEIRKSSKMSIRFSSSCKVNDFYYRLDGSSSSLNKLLGNSIDYELKYFEEQKEQRELDRLRREEEQRLKLIERRKQDSLNQIRVDSIKSWERSLLSQHTIVKDSMIDLFARTPIVNGQTTDYKIDSKTFKKMKYVFTSNAEKLKPEYELVGFNLKPSGKGVYKVMMIYIDDEGNRQSKYLYQSVGITSDGVIIEK